MNCGACTGNDRKEDVSESMAPAPIKRKPEINSEDVDDNVVFGKRKKTIAEKGAVLMDEEDFFAKPNRRLSILGVNDAQRKSTSDQKSSSGTGSVRSRDFSLLFSVRSVT